MMLHADQDGEKLQALLRLVIELLERVKIVEALSTVPQKIILPVAKIHSMVPALIETFPENI